MWKLKMMEHNVDIDWSLLDISRNRAVPEQVSNISTNYNWTSHYTHHCDNSNLLAGGAVYANLVQLQKPFFLHGGAETSNEISDGNSSYTSYQGNNYSLQNISSALSGTEHAHTSYYADAGYVSSELPPSDCMDSSPTSLTSSSPPADMYTTRCNTVPPPSYSVVASPLCTVAHSPGASQFSPCSTVSSSSGFDSDDTVANVNAKQIEAEQIDPDEVKIFIHTMAKHTLAAKIRNKRGNIEVTNHVQKPEQVRTKLL